MVKLVAAERWRWRSPARAMPLHGGNGYTTERQVERALTATPG